MSEQLRVTGACINAILFCINSHISFANSMESGEHAGHVQASNVTKVCKLPCMHNLFLHIPTDLFDEFGHV